MKAKCEKEEIKLLYEENSEKIKITIKISLILALLIIFVRFNALSYQEIAPLDFQQENTEYKIE